MMKRSERTELQGGKTLDERIHRPNLEKLVALAEELDDDGKLITAFLAILKMCFQS